MMSGKSRAGSMRKGRFILIVAVAAICVSGAIFSIVMNPGWTDMSTEPVLAPLVDHPLVIKRTCYVYKRKKRTNEFESNELTDRIEEGGKPLYTLRPGTVIQFEQIGVYTDKVSGRSLLWAVGGIHVPGRRVYGFVYRMGDCKPELYDATPYQLPMQPWQDSTDRLIVINKKEAH